MGENIENIVVDASFLLSVLIPGEEEIGNLSEVFKQYEKNKVRFVAPKILKYEVYNVIRTARVNKNMTQKLADEILDRFDEMEIIYLDVNFRKTFYLAIEYGLSFYDASYLHVSKENGYKLASLDKRLLGTISQC